MATLKANLSVKSIEELRKKLKKYKQDLLAKIEQFTKELAESGIEVANANLGGYGKYITFFVKTDMDKHGCTGLLVATNTGIIRSEWYTQDGLKTADVSPLLMVEFGSGLKAQNPLGIEDVGTGTFPGQTHAFEEGWWYATELDAKGNPTNWHYSSGIEPKAPMYKASLEIRKKVVEVARKVFS